MPGLIEKLPETDAIFANIREHDRDCQGEAVMRLSMDCKATVNIGDYSRGGKTRGDNRAADHDFASSPLPLLGLAAFSELRHPARAGRQRAVVFPAW